MEGMYGGLSWKSTVSERYIDYNRVVEEITFSTSEPFNDYDRMADQEFGIRWERTDRLEALWEAGAVDGEIGC